jgi:hypothetical protein
VRDPDVEHGILVAGPAPRRNAAPKAAAKARGKGKGNGKGKGKGKAGPLQPVHLQGLAPRPLWMTWYLYNTYARVGREMLTRNSSLPDMPIQPSPAQKMLV